MPSTTHEPARLLERLREGTRAEHRAVERTLAERPLEAQLAKVLQSELFGCLDVLEESTLDGQFIRRNVQSCLGVTPERGGRFFAGYGPAIGTMSRSFRSACASRVRGD